MRKKNYKGRCEKRVLSKCIGIGVISIDKSGIGAYNVGNNQKGFAYLLKSFRTRDNYRQMYQPVFGQKTTIECSYYA